MATSKVTLDVTQYVRVNIAYTSMHLQAHRDDVRIVMSTAKPVLSNTAFMLLGGDDNPLPIPIVDVNVWALAMSETSSLIVNEASVLQPVQIYSNGGIPISDVVPSVVITEIDHWLIHLGLSFIGSDTLKGLDVVPSGGGIADFTIVNPTAFEVHLKDFEFTSTEGDAELIFYRNVTSSGDGSSVPLNNKNFNSDIISDAVAQLRPTTVSTVGATHIQHFGLVGGKKSGGLAGSGVEEYVLKQNEVCLLRYINNAVNDDAVSYKLTTLNVGRIAGLL